MNFWFTIREGFRGFGRARLSTFITISSMGFALLLVGYFLLFAINVNQLIRDFRARIELEAYMDADIGDKRGVEIKNRIAQLTGVKEVQFISKQDAARRFKEEFGHDVEAILETNPLPVSCIIKLVPEYQDVEHITSLVNEIYKIDGINDVAYHRDFILLVTRYINLIYLVGGGAILLLIFISMVLLYNTIRLTIIARSDIIEIMKLTGATRRFVRRPFLVEGFLQGIIGAILGCTLLLFTALMLKIFFYPDILHPWQVYGILFLIGSLVGMFSSRLSIGRYLKAY